MNQPSDLREEIAIIGMAGRFPGAKNVERFWRNLCDGVESVSFFTPEELAWSGIDPSVLKDTRYVRAGAVLDEADCFDASFFGINPREAEITDPQHRVLLECSWEALEDAGYDPEGFKGCIGVFAGVGPNTYFPNNLAPHRELLEMVGPYQAMIGNEGHFPASRVSYKLNLKGPSVNVQTACSTSGVAIHFACQSLLSGECDMALAGGARIRVPLRAGYFYVEDGIPSPDGHCRVFDAKARGTVYGSGAAIVVLKRLSEAIRDRDCVYAVIKGSAVNNDGSAKVGFTAPSVKGQAAVIAEAFALAEVSADTIGYVEAHGTGTALGDPIEIMALTNAFRETTDRAEFCAIASLKSNVGHLDAAAGAAAVIKAALALRHGLIPPSLHFEEPNPEIDFRNSPFYVTTRLTEWNAGDLPRRAAVSSFGLGGTNAHIVLEEAPTPEPSRPSEKKQILVLSAKTETALEEATENLSRHLRAHQEINLVDVAYTLQTGRRCFTHRRALVCADVKDAVAALESPASKRLITEHRERQEASVAFMFPGQGAQYVNMGVSLYREEPLFRANVDECAEVLAPHLGVDLRTVLYPEPSETATAEHKITETFVTQPALFVIEYALAQLWMEWGVRPQSLIGHSLGEYVAACIAGVMSREDALLLVAKRARLMQELPGGAMLAVLLPASQLEPLLVKGVALAAVNTPSLCVVSGSYVAIATLQSRLAERTIECRQIRTSHAFHSEMMDPILDSFTELVSKVILHPPQVPWISCLTGDWITAAQATDPIYWTQQLRQTVQFSQSVQKLLTGPATNLLEVGPGRTLSNFAKQHLRNAAENTVLSSLHHTQDSSLEMESMLDSLARLWVTGVYVEWRRVRGEGWRRVPLPTYPFQRKRYWIDPPKFTSVSLSSARVEPSNGFVSITANDFASGTMNDKGEQMAQSEVTVSPTGRKDRILQVLKGVIHDLSGIDPACIDAAATFVEMGFDSLLLTRANVEFQKKFGVKITFRQLFEEAPSPGMLADYIDERLSPEAFAEPAVAPTGTLQAFTESGVRPQLAPVSPIEPTADLKHKDSREPETIGALERVISQQIQLMSEQLRTLRDGASMTETISAVLPSGPIGSAHAPKTLVSDQVFSRAKIPSISDRVRSSSVESAEFGPFRPLKKGSSGDLTSRQRKYLDALIARSVNRTKESKRLTQAHRPHLADPRTVAGFRAAWKEMVYPIVTTRSSGSRLWDVDGNEYIDVTMGFGVNLLGHSLPFVTQALEEQLKKGIEIGPQSPLAGKVAKLICEFTGMERAAFCNTGSEAVLASIRMARTVTGRDKIALFAGDYHGIFDEVLVRGIDVNGRRLPVPVAPGIPQKMVEDVMVLDYGDLKSLDILRARADEVVQSW